MSKSNKETREDIYQMSKWSNMDEGTHQKVDDIIADAARMAQVEADIKHLGAQYGRDTDVPVISIMGILMRGA